MIGRSMCGATRSAKAMNERFSSTGVKAGTLKRPHVLSRPAEKETRETKRMYGKQILNIATVSANLSGSFAKPADMR
jgi:hypothetical protein